jgi:hypothetical protein
LKQGWHSRRTAMKVYELIKELQNLPPDAEVSIWQNGDRYAINMIDWWDDDFVDLNGENSNDANKTI